MTRHLQPDEFVTALEGTADARVAAHLASCASCRDGLATLRVRWDEVAAVDVPEPSPLFWDHLAARVREATTTATAAERRWSPRRVVWTMAAVPAALVLAAVLTWFRPIGPAMTSAERVEAPEATTDLVEFEDLLTAFDRLTVDDVESFAPAGAATWVMVDDLTDEERMVFVGLIEKALEALP